MITEQVEGHLDLYPEFRDLTGKKVLLKVNLLSASEPERMVTTHPVFVEALVNVVRGRGGRVIIGDSPGGIFSEGSLRKCYRETGLEDVAERTGAELNYNISSHREKHLKGRFVKSFNICDYMRDCDLIIAVPKIKTHMFCGLTCASKIMFGAIPGMEKAKYHTRFPDPVVFSDMLQDLTDLCNVDIFLVEGIVGMDGNGPARGNPRKTGVIISGRDHSRIDLHVCRMTGLDPERIPMMVSARNLGLIDPEVDLNLSGSGSGIRVQPDFEPSTKTGVIGNLPAPIKKMVMNLTTAKPLINKNKCVGCGVCRDNCAGDAIKIVKGRARIKYGRCIRCYCCHELCPHDAVDLREKDLKLIKKAGRIARKLIPGR